MAQTDGGWGELIGQTISFGREDRSPKFKEIQLPDDRYENFTHCSHVMVYAKTKSEFEGQPKKATILMQMRFDGYIGFPGGTVNKDETPLQAICRELKEEMGWSEDKGAVSESDYMFSQVDEENELVTHLYVTEVTEEKLSEIESNLLKASDYGNKVLGHFRVPLYTMGDAFKGFPSFLKNHFVANAKLQLIEATTNLKLLTEEQIVQALHSAPKITH